MKLINQESHYVVSLTENDVKLLIACVGEITNGRLKEVITEPHFIDTFGNTTYEDPVNLYNSLSNILVGE